MRRNISFFLMMFLFLFSCEEDEILEYKYANSPHIELLNLSLAPSNFKYFDTLIVKLKIADKEGDLGINPLESNYYPYHPQNYIIDSNGEYVTFNDEEMTPPFYKVFEIEEGVFDTSFYADQIKLPNEFNCYDYELVINNEEGQIQTVDTVFIEKNENHYNIIVDIISNNTSTNENLKSDYCIPKHRFILGKITETPSYSIGPFDIEKLNQFEIHLSVRKADIYSLLFSNESIMFSIKVKDRALNTSNVIETDYYTIEELRNGIK